MEKFSMYKKGTISPVGDQKENTLKIQWSPPCRKYSKFLIPVWQRKDAIPQATSFSVISTDWSDKKHPGSLK